MISCSYVQKISGSLRDYVLVLYQCPMCISSVRGSLPMTYPSKPSSLFGADPVIPTWKYVHIILLLECHHLVCKGVMWSEVQVLVSMCGLPIHWVIEIKPCDLYYGVHGLIPQLCIRGRLKSNGSWHLWATFQPMICWNLNLSYIALKYILLPGKSNDKIHIENVYK